MWRPRGLIAIASVVTLIWSLTPAGSAAAAELHKLYPSGRLDLAHGSQVLSAGGPATGHKPESKLFYTPDGRWWAVLGVSTQSPSGVHLFELVDHTWVSRFVLPGADPWEKADTLFQDGHLYISLRDQDANSQAKLFDLTYGGNSSWNLVSGPTVITNSAPETITIARDSQGRMWSAWEMSGSIRVRSADTAGQAFVDIPFPSGPVTSDDIAAVTSFGTNATGRKIGIAWSDQVSNTFKFAWRSDAAPLTADSWHIETAYGNGVGGCPTATASLCSDDHVNIKTNGDEVYVAVKTSLNDVSGANPNDPLIGLLRRDVGGSWDAFPVSPVSQNASRPIVVLAPEVNEINVFAQRNFSTVQLWRSTYSSPSFDPSAATPWAASSNGVMNDPSSTKQLATASTGIVAVTSVESRSEYWHNELEPSTAPQPPSPSPSSPPAPTPSPTPTAGSSTLRFSPTADAYIRSDQPAANFGNENNLKVDNSPVQQSLLRFNVSGTAGRTVTSAKLRVRVINPGPFGGDIRRVTGAWSESSVTWNSRPAFDPSVLGSLGSVTTNTWYEIDVTSAVTGDGQIDLLSTTVANDGVDYVSSEGVASLRPELVVNLGGGAGASPSPSSPPAPTPSPTPTAGSSTLRFSPTADAYIRSDQPAANFGNENNLKVDNSPVQQSLLRFNVSGTAGRTVTSAKLRVRVINPGPFGGDIRRVTGAWSESSVTWNSRPAFDPSVLGSLGSVTTNTWYEIDVTSAVTGDGQIDLLSTTVANDGVDYVSSEGVASLRPELVVTLGP